MGRLKVAPLIIVAPSGGLSERGAPCMVARSNQRYRTPLESPCSVEAISGSRPTPRGVTPLFAQTIPHQLLPGEIDAVGGAELLGFFQDAQGALGFAGFAVKGGEQVEAVAKVAVVVLAESEIVARRVL